MNDALQFAHPFEHRAQAKAAIDEHGSLRKAAAATGIPRSTIHDWRRQGFPGIEAPETGDPIEEEASDGLDDESQLPAVASPAVPVAAPDDPSVASGDVPDTVPDAVPFTPVKPTGWSPDKPQALQAFLRYSNALLAGARPDMALRAAQVIDPAFGLTAEQDTNLYSSLTSLVMTEPGALSNPPDYVRSVYNKYGFTAADTDSLAGHLGDVAHDSYVAAINAQLGKVGRDPVAAITDPATLKRLNETAASQAAGIAETYNRDLASAVGQRWIDLTNKFGPQTSQIKLDTAVGEWDQDRSDWKAAQIANQSATQAYSDAMGAWRSNNDTVTHFRIVPSDGQCDECQDMCAQYSDWTPIDELDGSGVDDLPAHTGCVHEEDDQHEDIPDDQELWTGQDGDGDSAGN